MLGSTTDAFTAPFSAPIRAAKNLSIQPRRSPSLTILTMNGPTPEDIGIARTAFYFWFVGASGGTGIARSAFPRMYRKWSETIAMKGRGPTLGGEKLGISPLCGYPEDLYRSDVESIVNKVEDVGVIVEKYPVEGNFLAEKGYLCYNAFERANEGENPLAVRAVFDSLNTNNDVCSPDVAQEKFDSYKIDLENFKSEIFRARLTGYASIVALLFLLALADYESIAVHAREGWFPDWPGFSNLPSSLFDPEIGLSALPNYFFGDDPHTYVPPS